MPKTILSNQEGKKIELTIEDTSASIHHQLLEMYYRSTLNYRFADQLSKTPLLTELHVINRVEVSCEVWQGVVVMQCEDKPVVCCRLVTSPVHSKGDKTHYVQEAMLACLKIFSAITVKSDERGLYFIW